MSRIPAIPETRRVALLLAAVLEIVVVLPFAAVDPDTVQGLPSAIALAFATAVALLLGTVEGVVVAEVGAIVFAVFVSKLHPGGLAALGIWPLLVLLAGLFADRVSILRLRLEGRLETANRRLRGLVDTGIGLGSALDLDRLLKLVVEAARSVTGAEAATLDVVDRGGSGTTEYASGPPVGADGLSVPILLRGIAYGHLRLGAKESGEPYSDDDRELLELLATQAAVAIDNRRLYESVSRWSWQLESLTELSSELSSELELSSLLELVTRSLRRLVDARATAIWLPGADGLLRVEGADGAIADDLRALPPLGPDSKSGRVFASGRAARVDSLLDDPEVDHTVIRRLEIESGLWVPLAVGNEIVGVVGAFDKASADRRFTDEDGRLAGVFAARAAASVAVARRAEQEALRKVVAAQEIERRRIAIALHDGTAQDIASILLRLRSAGPEFEEVRTLLVETLTDVRRLSVELHPKALDDFGLVPALERLTETVSEHSGIEVQLEASVNGARFSREAETALFRIVQEALENVTEHSGAEHASVLVVRRGDAVSAVVEDDGCGFDPVAQTDGFGLAGIRERVRLLGGSLSIESRPGAGATIAAKIPV